MIYEDTVDSLSKILPFPIEEVETKCRKTASIIIHEITQLLADITFPRKVSNPFLFFS